MDWCLYSVVCFKLSTQSTLLRKFYSTPLNAFQLSHMHIFTLWWMHWEQFGVFWVNTLTHLWQHAPICWYNSLLHQKWSPYIWSKTGSDHDINTTMVRRLNEVLMVEFSVRFSREIKYRYFWLLRYLQRVTACFDMAEFYAGCSSWHNPREIFVCSQGWTEVLFSLVPNV